VDNDQFNTTIKSCILDRMCLILICPGMFSHVNSGCQEATSLNFERILCLWQCDVINMKPDLDTFSLDIFWQRICLENLGGCRYGPVN
jgi:hypothetical protein